MIVRVCISVNAWVWGWGGVGGCVCVGGWVSATPATILTSVSVMCMCACVCVRAVCVPCECECGFECVYVCVSCAYVRMHVLMCVYVGGEVGLNDANPRSQTASATPYHQHPYYHHRTHGQCHNGTSFPRLSFVPALCGVIKKEQSKV